jgi:curved DNA-binding protein CbpA
LAGLLELESQENAAARRHEASLSPQARTFRDEIVSKGSSLETLSYYQLLNIQPDTPSEQIKGAVERLIERYSSPEFDTALLESEKSFPARLIEKAAQAHKVLSDPAKRAEYDQFLASGRAGSFAQQSVGLRVDEFLTAGNILLTQGKETEALTHFEKAVIAVAHSPALVIPYARLLLKLRRNDRTSQNTALAVLKATAEAHPSHAGILELLGIWLEQIGEKEKALTAYRKALAVFPFSAAAKEGLARLTSTDKAPREILEAIAARMDQFTYYDLLQVQRDAQPKDIQKAYRDCTRNYHPDRFFQSGDPSLPEIAKKVYKRMVEAYMTLKNHSKRKEYDELLKEKGHQYARQNSSD